MCSSFVIHEYDLCMSKHMWRQNDMSKWIIVNKTQNLEQQLQWEKITQILTQTENNSFILQVRIGHKHRFSFFSCWYILKYIFVHYHYRCHIKTIFLLYFFTLFNITSLIRSFINHQLSGEWDNFAKLRWTNNRQIIYIIRNYSKYIDTQGTWLINKYKTLFFDELMSDRRSLDLAYRHCALWIS